MKCAIPLLICLFSFFTLSAQIALDQQVIGSTGADASTGDISLSYTAGELVVATSSSGNFIYTQGFQQPTAGIIESTQETTTQIDYRLYPNPTSRTLFVDFDSPAFVKLVVQIYDLNGRLLMEEKIQFSGQAQSVFEIDQLPSASYILKFFDPQENELKADLFQVIR